MGQTISPRRFMQYPYYGDSIGVLSFHTLKHAWTMGQSFGPHQRMVEEFVGVCRTCGRMGHKAQDCPYAPERPYDQMDTGATMHYGPQCYRCAAVGHWS